VSTSIDNQSSQGSVQSAGAYVPPIGHSVQSQIPRQSEDQHGRERASTNPWDQNERFPTNQRSNSNLQHLYQSKNGSSNVPAVPPIPSQFANNTPGQGPRLAQHSGLATNQQARTSRGSTQSPPAENFMTSPMDVPTLIATKGYNPAEFDTRPLFVRTFLADFFQPHFDMA
jgi:YTH domain-containing family protein